MTADGIASQIETIERGYEYLLAYAAQGRQDDAGTEARHTLEQMHGALDGLGERARRSLRSRQSGGALDVADFLTALDRDARIARGAIGLVLSQPRIASLLVDNLNASVHVRALLTDLFLLEQALEAGAAPAGPGGPPSSA